MTFFFGNCCLKLNYLFCGSNETTLENRTKNKKKKKKFKSRHNGIVIEICSNKNAINRGDPLSIHSYQQPTVNVSSCYNTLKQEQNSERQSLQWQGPSKRNSSVHSHDSLCSSSIDHRLWRTPSRSRNNGITIKDVILRRVDPHERLGLTLCYGVTSRSTTNIYIQQVDRESVAGRCGQLQSGDQIVKINNHRVTSREQAINLVQGVCLIVLQIFRFEFVDIPLMTTLQSPMALTEDDSGVMLACPTDLETTNEWIRPKSPEQWNSTIKSCTSLSKMNICSHCRRLHLFSNELRYRRCLSLNDLRPCPMLEHQNDCSSSSHLIRSQSLFLETDSNGIILKPLPLNDYSKKYQQLENHGDSDSGLPYRQAPSSDSCSSYRTRHRQNQWTLKYLRRRCREERLKRQYQSILTTDDEAMSELKQGRYWTREQRKEHLIRAREHRQRARFFQDHADIVSSQSVTEDFNLLNRVFLRENQQELKAKPQLAEKFSRQTSIEREKLKQAIQQHYNRMKTQSTTTISLSTNNDHPPMVIL